MYKFIQDYNYGGINVPSGTEFYEVERELCNFVVGYFGGAELAIPKPLISLFVYWGICEYI